MKDIEEIQVSLAMRVSTLRGTHELLQDLLEELTAASFTASPEERYRVIRLKLTTLLTLMDYELDGLEDTVNNKLLKGAD